MAGGCVLRPCAMPGARHELGDLARAFNDMTRRIHRAQSQSKRSQQEAEIQRAYLETVMGRLSSGVLTFNQRLLLRTHTSSVQIRECASACGSPNGITA